MRPSPLVLAVLCACVTDAGPVSTDPVAQPTTSPTEPTVPSTGIPGPVGDDGAYTGPERVLYSGHDGMGAFDPTGAEPVSAYRVDRFLDFSSATLVDCTGPWLAFLGAEGTRDVLLVDAQDPTITEYHLMDSQPLAVLETGSRLWIGTRGTRSLQCEGDCEDLDLGVSADVDVLGLTATDAHLFVLLGRGEGVASVVQIHRGSLEVVAERDLPGVFPYREHWVSTAPRPPATGRVGSDWHIAGLHPRSAEGAGRGRIARVGLDPFEVDPAFRSAGPQEPAWLGVAFDRDGTAIIADEAEGLSEVDPQGARQSVLVDAEMEVGLPQFGSMAVDSRGSLWSDGVYLQLSFMSGLVEVDRTSGVAVRSHPEQGGSISDVRSCR